VARDPEAAYFQTVEEFFVSRRGDPLFLSNADWLLIRKWRRAGFPLRVVLRGIADALDSHQHSFSRDQKVRSLSYCAAEVEVAAERWRRSFALGAADEDSGTATLDALAAALEGSRTTGAAARPVAAKIAQELRSKMGEPRADLSAWLVSAEKKLLRALSRDQGEAETARMEAEVEGVLAPYKSRMPEKVLEQIREEARARRLLEAHGLPRLSLFHAKGEGEKDAGAA
jgi:hypothetical protein